ncbi:MAG: hypothetical protein LC101_08145 [Flavobacteriales bacterium]|nr:hypothetical protein [Flavobacteriales bacterium]
MMRNTTASALRKISKDLIPGRVLQGESWNNYASYCHVAYRIYLSSDKHGFIFSFQVVYIP